MKSTPKLCLLFAALAFLAAPPDPAQGQVIQSTILGTVTDPSGGVIAGATVTVKNEGTSFERTMVTDESGDYRIAGLEVGSYQVSVTAQGFKTFIRSKISLDSSQIKRVDANLEVGDATSTVTVVGDVGRLETETASLSNVKSSQDFVQLPQSIYGRGWPNVVFVTAGVQSGDGATNGCCGVVINGARDTANNFTSDGITVNDVVGGRQTANGFPGGDVESYQELKIMTANNSAEYPAIFSFPG